jgi:anti-sigma regulatory factor (Ser/Thr protein kinase)
MAERRRQLHLARNERAPRAVRDEIEALTGDAFAPDFVATAKLLATELTTNALSHSDGQGPIRVEIVVNHGVTVRVEDGGRGFVPTARPADAAPSEGRWGLELVRQLSDDFGVDTRDGCVVWFRVRLSRSAITS